ncbi:DUF6308 family protein [Euzebya sp.]|uniref:DUF6308 family protein n=1 Tax=Euzebya sp. TaxID=1971409 RepID=UPI0035172AF7
MSDGDAPQIWITGDPIDPRAAVEFLVERYPRDTVRYYDYADMEVGEDRRSPVDDVTLTDLGRLTCIGAGLTYERSHVLLREAADAPWPELDVAPLTAHAGGEQFVHAEGVAAMWVLFDYWTSLGGLAFGTVGKLLHIKWPDFVPITDSEFLGVYQERAVKHHNASMGIKESVGDQRAPTKTANVRAYWMAFREDLVASSDGLAHMKELLRDLPADSEQTVTHVQRLSGLTDLRLLDALVWGRSRGRV